jgi:hypothetical protein
MAGLKNGAVEGSPTATPVLPIAMARGSNVSNGKAIAHEILNNIAASKHKFILILSIINSP